MDSDNIKIPPHHSLDFSQRNRILQSHLGGGGGGFSRRKRIPMGLTAKNDEKNHFLNGSSDELLQDIIELSHKKELLLDQIKEEQNKSPKRPDNELVLKIACPNPACTLNIILLCPYCKEAPLSTTLHDSCLTCPHCDYFCDKLRCQCGYALRASHADKKATRLHQLLEEGKDHQLTAILIGSAVTIGAIYLLT